MLKTVDLKKTRSLNDREIEAFKTKFSKNKELLHLLESVGSPILKETQDKLSKKSWLERRNTPISSDIPIEQEGTPEVKVEILTNSDALHEPSYMESYASQGMFHKVEAPIVSKKIEIEPQDNIDMVFKMDDV